MSEPNLTNEVYNQRRFLKE